MSLQIAFLTQEQRDGFGRYVDAPSREELERYFHLSDDDYKILKPLRPKLLHSKVDYKAEIAFSLANANSRPLSAVHERQVSRKLTAERVGLRGILSDLPVLTRDSVRSSDLRIARSPIRQRIRDLLAGVC
ncbi:DUF4158 domain-containing protein [Dokdonella soli]|uniref:DUF4158 domain-containing protein n=1 Tax=Dokdonella soli TaxID=529810 RepID=A0ABN1IM94_9GAMM